MTDPTLDPRDDRLDDIDAPRDGVDAVDEPIVNLDETEDRPVEEQTSDHKYVQVIDGRPETLGVEVQDGPADRA